MQDTKIENEIQVGPLSILQYAVNNQTQILVSCRNNKKLLGQVKAFDRHTNLVMVNVKELWTEMPRKHKGKRIVRNFERFIPKMFLRGDSIILIAKNPFTMDTSTGKGN